MKFLRIPLGTYFGVPLIMHPSLTIMLILACFVSFLTRSPHTVAYLSCVYLSVILHEYGHIVSAQKLNYKCQEVVMSFIGGIAKIEVIHFNPKDELIISVCGPLVNLAICIFLSLFWATLISFVTIADFIRSIIIVNFIIMAFNLIPVFPMDGGRIFRASLALYLNFKPLKATVIAVRVGQAIAFFGFIYAIYSYSIFIFFIAPVCAFLGQLEILRLKELTNNDILKSLIMEIKEGKPVRSVRETYLSLVHDKSKAECLLDFLEDWQDGKLDKYKNKLEGWTDKILDLEGDWDAPVKDVVLRESVKNASLFVISRDNAYLRQVYDLQIRRCVRYKTAS